MTETTTGLLKLGDEYGAHNYHPLPVVAPRPRAPG
jgi:hypothetical protein